MKKCNCVSQIEQELAKHNTRLAMSIVFDSRGGAEAFPLIQTEVIEKKRGAKPLRILPSHCPWCGAKYPQAGAEQASN